MKNYTRNCTKKYQNYEALNKIMDPDNTKDLLNRGITAYDI